MTSDKSVTATWIQEEYLLTLNVVGTCAGTVTADPDLASYHYGDLVTLTATPAQGCIFERWGGDVSGTERVKAIHIQGDTYAEAYFAPRPLSYVFLPVVYRGY
jgi:hypothetical protein